MDVIALVVVAVILVVFALAAWRFLTLRSRGATALIRPLKETDSLAWRHGVIRYKGDVLHFYKLRSLAPRADLVIQRTYATVVGHRRGADEQDEMVDDDQIIVEVDNSSGGYEFALEHHAAKAVIAWIESAPSARLDRADHKTLLMKANRRRKR